MNAANAVAPRDAVRGAAPTPPPPGRRASMRRANSRTLDWLEGPGRPTGARRVTRRWICPAPLRRVVQKLPHVVGAGAVATLACGLCFGHPTLLIAGTVLALLALATLWAVTSWQDRQTEASLSRSASSSSCGSASGSASSCGAPSPPAPASPTSAPRRPTPLTSYPLVDLEDLDPSETSSRGSLA